MGSLIKQYRHDRAVTLGKIDYLSKVGVETNDIEDCKKLFQRQVDLFKLYDELTDKLLKAIDNSSDANYFKNEVL